MCIRRAETCGARPACGTDYVGCAIACHGCVPDFGTCGAKPGADLKACQTPFIACLKTALAARPTNRPMIEFAGGDGATLETSVVVLGAMNEAEGISAENFWAV